MVAHEVKNPLAGISGALQVVGSRLAAESRDRKVLDDIEDRIAALNRMLQDLLTFASPREPAPAPGALRAVIGEAAAAIRRDPAMSGIEVEIRGDDPTLPLDREQMHIVFLNVLLNAAQAMGLRGEIEVDIGTAPGGCVVTVADRGPGIAPALREKVFQPFFSTRSRGAGLGLPTARRIVESHGGSLTRPAARGRRNGVDGDAAASRGNRCRGPSRAEPGMRRCGAGAEHGSLATGLGGVGGQTGTASAAPFRRRVRNNSRPNGKKAQHAILCGLRLHAQACVSQYLNWPAQSRGTCLAA